jgi:hypothetical protein
LTIRADLKVRAGYNAAAGQKFGTHRASTTDLPVGQKPVQPPLAKIF